MALVLARRLVSSVLVIVGATAVTFGLTRALQPELDPRRGLVEGVLHDLDRALLHWDWGQTCLIAGCLPVTEMWARDAMVDLYLIAGALLLGLVGGLVGGRIVARAPRSRRARALEAAATFAICAPVYLVAFGVLLLFEGTFGRFPVPWFVSPGSYAGPSESLWDFARSMVVPCAVLALPVAGAGLRLTAAAMADGADEPPIRSARARGLSERAIHRRYAAPAAYPVLGGYLGVSAPTFVLNVVLVEYVFFLPGAFMWTKRALGQDPPNFMGSPDMPLLHGLAVWAAVLIVLIAALSDIAQSLLDPRTRAAMRRRSRSPGIARGR